MRQLNCLDHCGRVGSSLTSGTIFKLKLLKGVKKEILNELRIHYPQAVNTSYFPYVWELITPEDCIQKKRISSTRI